MADAADLSIIEAAVMHAATDPSGWQAVTEAVADAFPGTRPNFLDYDLARGPGAVAYQARYEDAYLRSYHAHYRTVVPGFPTWAGLPAGHVAPLGEIVSERDLLRSEFWSDWLRPQGDLRQSALTVLHREGGRRILFGVPVERRAAGRVMAPLVRAMRRLHPLMRHALGVNRMLLGLRLDAALLAREVEPAQAAVLLLSAQGILLHASRRAEAMLAEGALVRHDLLGRTSLADPAGQARLEAALRPAPPGPTTSGWGRCRRG